MFFRVLILFLLVCLPVFADNSCQLIDAKTGKPIQGAKISIPQYNLSTKTDKEGHFELNANFDDKAIMQVDKSGYRPYSITIDKTVNNEPMKLEIEKMDSKIDIFTDREIYHLGDNVFSRNSADCQRFKVKSVGPFYSKKIKFQKFDQSKQPVIVFGSVIGLDTKMAKEMGQNKIISVYSSPMEIIFNGQKIAELNLNGDNLEIPIPKRLIKPENELVIKTGKNLFQYNYTDYDDMEFANLRIELKDDVFANKSN